MKVQNIELPDAEYTLECTSTTNFNARDVRKRGHLFDRVLQVGDGIRFNDHYKGWYTTAVQEIELKPDGSVVCKTMNSTYIIREVDEDDKVKLR